MNETTKSSKTRKWWAWGLLIAMSVPLAFFIPRVWRRAQWYALKREIAAFHTDGRDLHRFYTTPGSDAKETLIAHGGGVGDYVYTNSAEAVMDSIQKGFKFIEIDMLATTDGHIVGGHDWKSLAQSMGLDNADGRPMAYGKVRNLKISGRFTLLDGAQIAEVMRKNPGLVLVTDKIRDYDLLLKVIPFPERMVVEVFNIEDYANAMRAGVKYPAFCLKHAAYVPFVDECHIPIVTMNAINFFNDEAGRVTAQRMHDSGVTILLYNVDKFPEGEVSSYKLLGNSVSKIYSNKFTPQEMSDGKE